MTTKDEQTNHITAGQQLMDTSTQSEFDTISQQRKADLLTLANCVIGTIDRLGLNEGGSLVLSVALQVAYVFGQREAQEIPSAFRDL